MPEPIDLSDALPGETLPATSLHTNGRHHASSNNPNVIRIRGARQHNLKNVDGELPRDRYF
jgi:excinuclease ABC subunit A